MAELGHTLTSPGISADPAAHAVDPQIIEALTGEDRDYVLKLAELMESLINDGQRQHAVLLTNTDDQRSLVHRCCAYYRLVSEAEPLTDIIYVQSVPESRIPVQKLSQLVPAETAVDIPSPQLQVLVGMQTLLPLSAGLASRVDSDAGIGTLELNEATATVPTTATITPDTSISNAGKLKSLTTTKKSSSTSAVRPFGDTSLPGTIVTTNDEDGDKEDEEDDGDNEDEDEEDDGDDEDEDCEELIMPLNSLVLFFLLFLPTLLLLLLFASLLLLFALLLLPPLRPLSLRTPPLLPLSGRFTTLSTLPASLPPTSNILETPAPPITLLHSTLNPEAQYQVKISIPDASPRLNRGPNNAALHSLPPPPSSLWISSITSGTRASVQSKYTTGNAPTSMRTLPKSHRSSAFRCLDSLDKTGSTRPYMQKLAVNSHYHSHHLLLQFLAVHEKGKFKIPMFRIYGREHRNGGRPDHTSISHSQGPTLVWPAL